MVSVLTPTWGRHDVLLNRCVPSVEAQTYSPIEHVVVSDGPDPELRELLPAHVCYFELGRNMQALEDHWGAVPRLVGAYLAQGDLIAYLDDDNEYLPEHVECLVDEIERTGVDVVFAGMERVGSDLLCSGQVEHGQIDISMVLHRADLLWRVANWRPAGYASDWDLLRRWKEAGVGFVFVPRVTVRYHSS